MPQQQIKIGQYVYSQMQSHKIGKGSFADVYKGYDLERKEIVAIKVIDMQVIKANSKTFESLKREQAILKKINGPNIVQLKDIINTEKDRYLYIVTEFCNTGDLDAYLYQKRKNDPLSQEECLKFFRGFVRGYKILYDNNIIHRDIKPANMLINDDVIKIADFGLSKVIPKNLFSMLDQTKRVGSPLYMSPQVLGDQSYTDKCDVWSLGITFHEMLFRETPWDKYEPHNEEDLKRIYKMSPYKFPREKCLMLDQTKLIIDLIERMIVYEEKDRISWREIFEHPLISEKKKPKITLLGNIDHSLLRGSKIFEKNIEVAQAIIEANEIDETRDNASINNTKNTKNTNKSSKKIYLIKDSNQQSKQVKQQLLLQQDSTQQLDATDNSNTNQKNTRYLDNDNPKIGHSISNPDKYSSSKSSKIMLLPPLQDEKEDSTEESSSSTSNSTTIYAQRQIQHQLTPSISSNKEIKVVKEVNLTNEELQEISRKYEQEELKIKLNKISKHIDGALTLTDFLNNVMIYAQSERITVPEIDYTLMNKLLFVISKLFYIKCSELYCIKDSTLGFNKLYIDKWEDYIKTPFYKQKIKIIEKSYFAARDIFQSMLITVQSDTSHLLLEDQQKIYNDKLIFDWEYTKLFSNTILDVLKILAKKLEEPLYQNSRNFLILVDYLLKVYQFHNVFVPSNDTFFNFQRYNERLIGEKEAALYMKTRSKLVMAIKRASILN